MVSLVDLNSTRYNGVVPYDNAAELQELQGDTLTTKEAEEYVHAARHEACYEEHTAENSPLQSLPSPVLNRLATQATPRNDISPKALATIGNDNSERHIGCSDRATPQVAKGQENRTPHTPDSDPSPLQSVLDLPTDGLLIQTPKKFKIRSRRRPMTELAKHQDQMQLQTPTHKPRKPLILPRPIENNTDGHCGNLKFSRAPTDEYESSDRLRVASVYGATCPGQDASRYYGTLPLSRSALTQSLTAMGSDSFSSVTTIVDLTDTNTLPLAPDPSVHDQNITASPPFVKPYKEILEAAFSCPVESLRIWMKGLDYLIDNSPKVPAIDVSDNDTSQLLSPSSKDIQSSLDAEAEKSEPPLNIELAAASHPMTVIAADILHVYFPSKMSSDTYVVELNVDLLLSKPDNLGWQTFRIPGLPFEADSGVRGNLELQLVSNADDSAPIPPVQFDTRRFCSIRLVGEEYIESTFLVSEPFSLPLRLQAEINHVREWNSNVAISSSLAYKFGHGTCMKNHASLSIEPTGKDTFARRASFSVLVRNGPPSGGIYKLDSGQCSVKLCPYENTVTDFDRTVEIWIERDQQDMEKPLRLEFTCLYYSIHETSILLPVVFPKVGKVLSEKIWIEKPSLPLVLNPVIRKFLSTWTVNEQMVGGREVLCFLRMEMPSRYPNALSDDAIIRLRSHHPVSFLGLEVPDEFEQVEKCLGIVPLVNYVVDIVPRQRLECRMTFDLEVGTHQHLLKIEALEWVPKYALINGRICSQENPCWWEAGDHLCLFKTPSMMAGDILHIEMAFIMIGQLNDSASQRDQFIKLNGTLPRITDKVIFGGDLVCNIDDAVITLVSNKNSIDDEDMPFSILFGENTKRLPLLQRGYKLELMFKLPNPIWQDPSKKSKKTTRVDTIRFSAGIPLRPRILRFDDETVDAYSSSSGGYDGDCDTGEDLNMGHETPISNHQAVTRTKTALTAAKDVETGVDLGIEALNDGQNADRNANPGTDKEGWQHWKRQVYGSDVSSSSSDKGEAGPVETDEMENEDEHGHAGADEDADLELDLELQRGLGWIWNGLRNAFITFWWLVFLTNAVLLRLRRRSPWRFLMRYLVLFFIGISARHYSSVEGLLPGIPSAVISNQSEVTGPIYTTGRRASPLLLHSSEEPQEQAPEEKTVCEDKSDESEEREERNMRDRIDFWLGWRPIQD